MMSRAEIDRTITYGLIAFLAGGICWLCGLAVSAGMLLGLGAMSGSFNEWRTERGLWMLGALFLFVFGGFYALVIYHQIADWLAGRAPLDGLTALDWFIGTSALTYKIRFLWAVTCFAPVDVNSDLGKSMVWAKKMEMVNSQNSGFNLLLTRFGVDQVNALSNLELSVEH